MRIKRLIINTQEKTTNCSSISRRRGRVEIRKTNRKKKNKLYAGKWRDWLPSAQRTIARRTYIAVFPHFFNISPFLTQATTVTTAQR